MATQVETNQLKAELFERLAAERLGLIEKLVPLVMNFLMSRGGQKKHHSHNVWDLKDFNGFHFHLSESHSVKGGGELEVSFEFITVDGKFRPRILAVAWTKGRFDAKTCEVKEFYYPSSYSWPEVLLDTLRIRDADSVSEQNQERMRGHFPIEGEKIVELREELKRLHVFI